MANALDGLRVLDLSRVLAGPWATQLLGDLGAEIIKIEHPVRGDDTRSWGPPFQFGEDGDTREASYFLSANRNKKSVCVDISTEAGQSVIRELSASSDVLVENFKTGTLEKYGLDAASLRLINPRLIYCSITGFGHTGPYADQPGYDLLIQAMGGLMSVTGGRRTAEGRCRIGRYRDWSLCSQCHSGGTSASGADWPGADYRHLAA